MLQYIQNDYNILETIPGHTKPVGKHANIVKNNIWRVMEKDKDNPKEYLFVHCEPGVLVAGRKYLNQHF
ncbi:MAG: hypothetical protein EBR60_10310 [Burkholderiaceae bacterium]|nr:hypothetical protein [Burkholderiaceae bacterium]